MIMAKMHDASWDVKLACDFPTCEVQVLRTCASSSRHVVIMFTTSFLTSPRYLCALSLAIDDGALVMPVLLPNFIFPTPVYFDDTLPEVMKLRRAAELLELFCYSEA